VKVTEEKAYFYRRPKENTKKRSYLEEGDIVEFLEINGEFGYVEFIQPISKKITKGWICFEDVEKN
jgi:hypothetical protein